MPTIAVSSIRSTGMISHIGVVLPERSLDTVVRAGSAIVLAVLVGFTSLQHPPCAPAPATARRGMLVTNG